MLAELFESNAVTTWVCVGEVLAVEEREKDLAGKDGQQWGEVSVS